MNIKKILITGASGFTGCHACSYFQSLGYEVIQLASGQSQHINREDYIFCDLTNRAEVETLIMNTKPDYILHLAGKNHAGESWDKPGDYLSSNVMGTVHILEAVKKYKPDTKILVTGSMLETSMAGEKPNHPYGLSKNFQSTLSMAWFYLYKIPVLVVRPPNLIGPGNSTGVCSHFAKKIAECEKRNERKITLMVNNSRIKKTFLDVRDAVEVYGTILENGHPGKIYELDLRDRFMLTEIVDRFATLSSCLIEIEYLDSGETNTIQKLEKDHFVFGERQVKIPCPQKYKLEQSLKDILTYYRNAD